MPLSLLDIVGGIANGADVVSLFAPPWRFLFSHRYRERKRAQWRGGSPHRAVLEQIGGLVSIAVQIAVAAMLAALILHAYRSA
ncbi:MAG: hypothetical protein JSS16_08965 [Proteobacteria bacterium]|nr:hypothetical protein [Pseudomonadota bacterium]